MSVNMLIGIAEGLGGTYRGSIRSFSILAVVFIGLTSRAYYVAMLRVCKRGDCPREVPLNY